MMNQTNALSPEVKELFEIVSKQAKQYVAAFESISKELRNLERDKQVIQNLTNELPNRVEESITRLEGMVDSSLEKIQIKSTKTNQLLEELEEIEKLKRSVELLRAGLGKQTDEITRVLNDFNNKANNELESTLVNLKGKITAELEKEAEKIDVRLSLKIKQLEAKVATFDGRIRNNAEKQASDVKQINSLVDGNTRKIMGMKSEFDTMRGKVISRLQDYDKKFDRVSDLIDKSIRQVNSKIDELKKRGLGDEGEEEEIEEFTLANPHDPFAEENKPKESPKDKKNKTDIKLLEFEARLQIVEEKDSSEAKRNAISFWLATVSLVGMILVLLLLAIR